MLISELYTHGVALLKGAGVVEAELEASLLLAFCLQKSRTHIYLAGSEKVSDTNRTKFKKALAKRVDHIPLAYITGEQEFWSLSFAVSPDVLIPRPETEQMLEMVLSAMRERSSQIENVLDLGTGSGAIAVVLAKELEQASVVAVDRSFNALQIASGNIGRHGLARRVHCVCSDWGSGVQNGTWDLIVSNPPYIAGDVMNSLSAEVQNEPETALNGGVHGMETISVLTSQLKGLLKTGGWFFMEIGYDQEDYVLQLFRSQPHFDNILVHKDHAGLPRVLQARKSN